MRTVTGYQPELHALQARVQCPMCLRTRTELLPAEERVFRRRFVWNLSRPPVPSLCGQCWAGAGARAARVEKRSDAFVPYLHTPERQLDAYKDKVDHERAQRR